MKTSALDFLLSLAVIGVVAAASLLLTALAVAPFTRNNFGAYHVLADGLMFLLSHGVLSALVLRAILAIRPLTPGEYSMDHPQFTLWKLFAIVYAFGRGALLPFTNVFTKPLIPKLFGARLGQRVALGGGIADAPLVSVGERSILGHSSSVIGHAITSGRIILRAVEIGCGVTVGVNAVIWPGVKIGDGSIVAAGAVVTMDTNIPPNELWGGVPARKIKDVDPNVLRG